MTKHIWIGIGIVGATAWAVAFAGSPTRTPASTVPSSNGVVCAQGRAIAEAEELLNGKLATGQGEAITSMANKYGKIKGAKTTGVTVQLVNDPSTATAMYVICVSLAGDQN